MCGALLLFWFLYLFVLLLENQGSRYFTPGFSLMLILPRMVMVASQVPSQKLLNQTMTSFILLPWELLCISPVYTEAPQRKCHVTQQGPENFIWLSVCLGGAWLCVASLLCKPVFLQGVWVTVSSVTERGVGWAGNFLGIDGPSSGQLD